VVVEAEGVREVGAVVIEVAAKLQDLITHVRCVCHRAIVGTNASKASLPLLAFTPPMSSSTTYGARVIRSWSFAGLQ